MSSDGYGYTRMLKCRVRVCRLLEKSGLGGILNFEHRVFSGKDSIVYLISQISYGSGLEKVGFGRVFSGSVIFTPTHQYQNRFMQKSEESGLHFDQIWYC